MESVELTNEFLFQCLWVKHLGIECPGCGFQRAVLLLLNGELWLSVRMYPPLIPFIGLIVTLLVHLKIELKHGGKILTALFGFTFFIMMGNFFYKLFI